MGWEESLMGLGAPERDRTCVCIEFYHCCLLLSLLIPGV